METPTLAIMGRPREFDVNDALDRAIEVFWRKGYGGSSVAELTEAMGISPPSLYSAFGNKEGLFRRALDRYIEKHGGYWDKALAEPTARGMAEHLLHGCVDFLAQKYNPPGCMFARSAASCSEDADVISRELKARRAQGEARLRKHLECAKAAGELPRDQSPADLARYLMTVVEGMSAHAAGGASREELRKVADLALRAWPT
jgi:AcrR family transcriptional regulator